MQADIIPKNSNNSFYTRSGVMILNTPVKILELRIEVVSSGMTEEPHLPSELTKTSTQ